MREITGRTPALLVAAAIAALTAVLLAACTSGGPEPAHPSSGTPSATRAGPRSVLPGTRFLGDNAPMPAAVAQVQQLQASGQATQASALQRMLDTPQGIWLAGGTEGQVYNTVHAAVAQAAATGTVPVFVVYNIPERDCGDYSAGGAPDGAAYGAWIGALSSALGTAHALVLLEPDSLGNLPSSCTRHTLKTSDAQRLAIISAAITRLERQPAVSVYLDGTNSNWLKPEEAASRLVRAGVEHAQGFFLNVANFQSTAANEAFGDEVSERVRAATGVAPHYVIDTSRNGAGADSMSGYRDAPYAQSAKTVAVLRSGNWCNPPSARLGHPPEAVPAPHEHPLLDAYLWVKTVGTSDGGCDQAGGTRAWDYSSYSQPGWPAPQAAVTGFDPLWGMYDPAAGVWFPQAALGLIGG